MKPLLLFTLCATAWAQTGFDESRPDRLRIFTPTYELTLSKSNGSILGLTDKTAHAGLTPGSRNGCLWAATLESSPPYRGGCSPDSFHYQWDAGRSTLTLQYGSDQLSAAVTLTPHADFIDLQLALTNRSGATLQSVQFPSDLVFETANVQAAYLPYYLPGVRLKRGFFADHRSIAVIYPSARAFADYLALDIAGGHLAIYSVNPDAPIQGVNFGFRDDDKTRPGTYYAPRAYQTETISGARYQTPVVRVRVAQDTAHTIAAYRVDNHIDAYPDLSSKLGAMFDDVSRAPLVKMDFKIIGRTFAEVTARLDQIQAPALLHPVAYWPRSFDQNYPDFLPPNPAMGTLADFNAFIRAARARHLFVMPYTNPTWWDDQSPTVKTAGDPAALAVQGSDGKPLFESYGPNRGFVASLHSPAVRERLARLMAEWREEAPVDFVFQDQIGSRSWLRDFNPAVLKPLSYADDWLAFTHQFANQRLMTEDGWDRLASSEVGFDGSVLGGAKTWDPAHIRWGESSHGNRVFGAGNWEPYPLGVWLFHDKVLFYHHDLDHALMNAGVEVLTWNCAFGVMAGYLWPEMHGVKPDWMAIVNAFQPAVLSRLAGRSLSSYQEVAPEVTESVFGDIAVEANWGADRTYIIGGFTVAPGGCLITKSDGNLLAGVFVNGFNREALTDGPHYLVVERKGEAYEIRQPVGNDTALAVPIAADWDRGNKAEIVAVTRDGRTVGVRATQQKGKVRFYYRRTVGDMTVDHYEIRRIHINFM